MTMNLTSVQREVLLALVDLYQRSHGEAVKGEGIAELINRNPGTVRNLMQSLRSLALVDGVPGPKGGYRPTTEAYKALNFEDVKDAVTIPFYDKSGIIEGVLKIDALYPHCPRTAGTLAEWYDMLQEYSEDPEAKLRYTRAFIDWSAESVRRNPEQWWFRILQ